MKRYTVLTIIAVIATGMLVFWLTQRDWLINSLWWQKAEGALIDQRYARRGERSADTNIVLVGVETGSFTLDGLRPEDISASPVLGQMLEPYPWNRGVFAATLEKLMEAGAKVVVFDFLFQNSKLGDEEFARVLKKYSDHVVLASMIEKKEYLHIPPNPSLWPTNAAGGLVDIFPDFDQTVRRGRYRTSLEREDYRLNKFADADYPDNLIHMSALAVQKFAGTVDTPPYDHDNFIDFQGGRGTYRPVPIERLFVKADWETPPINGGILFSNKIVVVGPIAEIFKDIHYTVFGEMPGPEIQAQMMATLLHHSSLEEPSPTYNKILTLVMVLAALAICLFVTHAALKPVLLLGTLIGFFAACQYAFTRGGVVVAMMPPLFGFASTGAIGLVLQFFLEQIERRRYRNVLDRYVSKNVADTILADQRSFEESLSGQNKSVTILFSDIRGFTSMTEGRNPEQLVKQLNEYFKEMVGVVLEEKGTLQKFIGDAIMAAWGDAISEGGETDARHAVRTALRMRAGLAKLNAHWKTRLDRPPVQIGIGVNYGDAIVGNIGSPARMEFTVLGDVVNLAARLETATKQFQADILVGETVEALTREYFVFRKVGLLTVKGRAKPVEAFDVLGERPMQEPAWLKGYDEAVDLFRHRKFDEAARRFNAVSVNMNREDYLCQMYIDSCARYIQAPPPQDWAGNFVLTEK